MPRVCTACSSPHHAKIDAALAKGESARSIGSKFAVGARAVGRHYENHLSPAVVAIAAGREERRLGGLIDELEAVTAMAKRMLYQAEADGLAGQAQGWMREFRSCVELLLKATGAINERPQVTVNLLSSPEIQQLTVVLMQALQPYDEARLAVADALDSIDVDVPA
jgi:hypothetical protein